MDLSVLSCGQQLWGICNVRKPREPWIDLPNRHYGFRHEY